MLNAFQGLGAGSMLFDQALAVAHSHIADHVWLGVWEKNTKAIAFYRKQGFVEFDTHIFRLGTDEQTDILMKLRLRP